MNFGVADNSRGGSARLRVEALRFLDALALYFHTKPTLVITDNYQRLLNKFNHGELSLAWMPPLLHALACEKGARLVAVSERGGQTTYRAALLVHKDCGFRSPKSLKRCSFAWSDRYSGAGHLFPKLMLLELGFDREADFRREHFFGSKLAAAQAVAQRQADLCSCYIRDDPAGEGDPEGDLRQVLGSLAHELKIIALTEPIPSDGVVAAGSLSDADVEQLSAALVELQDHPQHKSRVMGLFEADSLRLADDHVRDVTTSWSARIRASGLLA
ncbi:MAG: PhnD/SsuA/transferrin family substrate-binding protein [Myxococcales bacterium]|nr:PhnD/SsuA/transferrin family substrate-binding protein [Myxococcales bacterium]